jgi:hypothetical protein
MAFARRESQIMRSRGSLRPAVEIGATTDYAGYAKEHIRYKCNQHKVKGVQVNYKSADKYVGDDAVDLLILFPKGFAWEVHVDVSVR